MLPILKYSPASQLVIKDLEEIPYKSAWLLQQKLQDALIAGCGDDTLLLCQHPQVITLGRGADEGNILLDRDQLATLGVEVHNIERGGDVTWHGPGQLVCYPIIDLRKKKKDVAWYVRQLEEVIIRSLKQFRISAFRISGKTGVWTGDSSHRPRKIAAAGVRISRWCTMHGFSLNINNCQQGFSMIHPCGLRDIMVTSIEEENADNQLFPPLEIDDVKSVLTAQFVELFDYS